MVATIASTRPRGRARWAPADVDGRPVVGACYDRSRVTETARQRFDFADYLLLEEMAEVKHEFLEGHVWAMAGGSPLHAAVCGNLMTLLNTQLLGRRCQVFTSDLRIRVKASGLGTYPDLTVVGGQLELDPDDPKGHTVTNPKLIVEVLSPSTEKYDRGEKFDHYRRIPAVEAVVLVAHDRREIEVRHREADDTWSVAVVASGSVHIAAIDCTLDLEAVYRDPLA
jgi:Uma2 family endonuclease